MAATSPVLAYPLRFAGSSLATVEEGSDDHLLQRAQITLMTRPGTMLFDEEFGLQPMLGTLGPLAPTVLEALQKFVPTKRFVADDDVSAIADRVRTIDVGLTPSEGG